MQGGWGPGSSCRIAPPEVEALGSLFGGGWSTTLLIEGAITTSGSKGLQWKQY